MFYGTPVNRQERKTNTNRTARATIVPIPPIGLLERVICHAAAVSSSIVGKYLPRNRSLAAVVVISVPYTLRTDHHLDQLYPYLPI